MIKWLINMVKKDLKTIGEILDGSAWKRLKNQHTKEEFKEAFSLKVIFLENYLTWLLILLAFFSGWFVASQYYQYQCNSHIIREYHPECVNPLTDEIDMNLCNNEYLHYWRGQDQLNITFNTTFEESEV